MLPRTAVIAVLLAGCAHSPAGKPQAQPTAAPVATTASATPSDPAGTQTATAVTKPLEFARDVRPILESRCQPCHFAGGSMYDRLPFDRPETTRQLGLKLLTRIKDMDSQATIRAYLSQEQ